MFSGGHGRDDGAPGRPAEHFATIRQISPPEREALGAVPIGAVAIGIDLVDSPRPT